MKPDDPSSDRRHEARLSPGDVECDIEGARFVHVLGVSFGGHGMRVMTEKPLPRDKPVAATIKLSESESLQFTGEVVWEKTEDFQFTSRYISGVKFLDNADGSARLHDFIEKHLAQQTVPKPNGDRA